MEEKVLQNNAIQIYSEYFQEVSTGSGSAKYQNPDPSLKKKAGSISDQIKIII